MNRVSKTVWLLALFALYPLSALGEDNEGHPVKLGEGKVRLTAPGDWEEKEPKFKGIVAAEFAVESAEGDKSGGRVTMGGLGGGVEPNLQRWMSQYTNAETERDELEIAGQKIERISIRGTYKGSRFRKEPSGPGFRLLGAVISTQKVGTYYIKFYGPQKTVDENEKDFDKMLKGLEVNP